jgi:hypothetical protein
MLENMWFWQGVLAGALRIAITGRRAVWVVLIRNLKHMNRNLDEPFKLML